MEGGKGMGASEGIFVFWVFFVGFLFQFFLFVFVLFCWRQKSLSVALVVLKLTL